MRRIAILGSTGSIGCSALDVIAAHPAELEVVALAAGQNRERFVEQIERFRPRAIAMSSAAALADVRTALGANHRIEVAAAGPEGLLGVATYVDADLVLCASAGTAALEAVLAAIEAGKTIALANKEVLVMAGGLVTAAARRRGVTILPVDSEHNAVHQCLHGRSPGEVRRLVLTASGGPFREWPANEIAQVSPADALRHPTWKMGAKITIDSATLMNKGLEVIEAHWLFDVPPDRIDVVIHPQSIVHSMVELRDGSVIAQLGITDMRLPIQYAFSYPDRWEARLPALDLTTCAPLEFAAPDLRRFPCLALAYRALRGAGSEAVVLNAANEVAVAAFLDGRMPFTAIPELIQRALDTHERSGARQPHDVAEVRAIDSWARGYAEETLRIPNRQTD